MAFQLLLKTFWDKLQTEKLSFGFKSILNQFLVNASVSFKVDPDLQINKLLGKSIL